MTLTQKSGKGNKIHFFVDGEYRFTSDVDFVLNNAIGNNIEIDEAELAELEKAVNSRRAFNKCADLLSMRDHSERELLLKLRQKGYSQGAEEAIEKMREYGYVNDERFAHSFANELAHFKKYGKRRIVQELLKKGIDREIISAVIDELEFDENRLVELIKRKYIRNLETEKGVQKTVNALLRSGYSYSEIKDALKMITDENDFTEAEIYE